jgi:signal transduction histidine kinase
MPSPYADVPRSILPRGEVDALVVVSDAADALLLEAKLHSLDASMFGPAIRTVLAESLRAAWEALGKLEPAFTLVDSALADATDMDALARIRARTDAPVIVVSDIADHDRAVRALHAGADDYLVKPLPDEHALGRTLRVAIERRRLHRQREALLAQTQRALSSRERASSMVAHDLRNPLHTIRICAGALRDPEPAPPESVRHMAALIDQSVDWMQQLVQDLVDRTSLLSGRLVMHRCAVDVPSLLEQARAMLSPIAERQGVIFTVSDASAPPAVFADPHRLLQVLSNLVGSALAMTPAGGTVMLSAHAAVRSSDDERRRIHRGVRFDVTDTGSGMSVDQLSLLYEWTGESLESVRTPWGLGLPIARGLIEAHGSQLHVSSVQGVGTSFSFVIAPEGHPSPNVFDLSIR